MIVAIAAIFEVMNPAYLSRANIHAILRHMAATGVVGVGLTFVIAVRRFDLSLSGVATIAAMTLGFLIAKTNSLLLGALGSVAIGAAFGLANGFSIGQAKLPDVVATIAIGSLAYGASYFYNGGKSYSDNFFTSGILDINDSSFLGIDAPILIFMITAAVATLVLQMTRYGHGFYAAGENPVAARLSGVPVEKMVAAAFTICGGLVGEAIVLKVSSVGQAMETAGSNVLLPAYTAVYLGAALFDGPSVPATFAGGLIMALLLNGFTLLGVPYYYSDTMVSAVLIFSVAIFDPRVLAGISRQLTVFAPLHRTKA
jgi:simple sugar transport system permease protein/ribose transport system permease protein